MNESSLVIELSGTTTLQQLARVVGFRGEVASTGSRWWYRDRSEDQRLDCVHGTRWIVSETGLRRPGELVSRCKIPDWHWQPLKERVQTELPRAEMVRPVPTQWTASMKLVRDDQPRPIGASIIPIDLLAEWTLKATRQRCRGLLWITSRQYACVRRSSRSQYLPPLPGTAFVIRSSSESRFPENPPAILVPAGLRWQPDLPTADVLRVLAGQDRKHERGWWMWTEDSLEPIDDELWKPLSRASVRMEVGDVN